MSSPLALLLLSSLIMSVLCSTLLSNKPELKTIKRKYGVFDCVDFFKQPAFNHPLLKNHASKAMTNLAEMQKYKADGIGLEDDACPTGTVPILRTQADIAIDTSGGDLPRPPFPPQEHCVAVVHTNNLNWKLYGIGGAITIHKPEVVNDQWSSARIKLINGNENIEAGWMVNPRIFEDNEAHLYAKFTTTTISCINLQCPGFVQVAKDVPLGAVPTTYSTFGKGQWFWNISIEQHQDDHNWWLYISKNKQAIGYWPKGIFTTLASYSNRAEWGGEIYNPGAMRPPPQMGNGFKANYHPRYSSHIMQTTIVNEDYMYVDPGGDTHKVWDCEDLYTVLDAGYQGHHFKRLLYFGGINDFRG